MSSSVTRACGPCEREPIAVLRHADSYEKTFILAEFPCSLDAVPAVQPPSSLTGARRLLGAPGLTTRRRSDADRTEQLRASLLYESFAIGRGSIGVSNVLNAVATAGSNGASSTTVPSWVGGRRTGHQQLTLGVGWNKELPPRNTLLEALEGGARNLLSGTFLSF